MAKLDLDPAALWWCQPDPDEEEGEAPRARRVRGLKEAADMDVTRFINEVRAREPLYNTACAQYGERALKAKMWKEVASIMKLSLHTCKAKWKSIRDSYVRELRRQERMAARGVDASLSRKRPYVHFEQLAFLAPTLHKGGGGHHSMGMDWKMDVGSEDDTGGGAGTASCADDTPEGEDSGLPALMPAPEVVVESVPSLGGPCGGVAATAPPGLTSPSAAAAAAAAAAVVAAASPDEDALFLQSLLPSLRRLPPASKSLLRIRIAQLVHDTLYPTSEELPPTLPPAADPPRHSFSSSSPVATSFLASITKHGHNPESPVKSSNI